MNACRKRINRFGRMPSNNAQSPNPTSHINISDVIAVLEATDPYYTNTLETNNNTKEQQQRSISPMYSQAGAQQGAQAAPQPTSKFHRPTAYVKIVEQPAPIRFRYNSEIKKDKITEQPASKSLRFRYECEGRSAGSIPGVNSTPENKTFPEIQIIGYQGPAVVVVSCVTKDAPYRAHPHNLVGREGCKKGVCTLQVPQDTMRVQFSNLGIQCVKRKEIDQSLVNRQQIRVDPFKQGFKHIGQTTSIDLNAVRLCFQVFIVDPNTNKCTVPLQPVVSDVIFDKKSMMELKITKLSDSYSFVDGGRKDMIILCEKVDKQDIAVKFFELDEKKQVVWEAMADLQPNQVWKQTAIWFKTPAYRTLDVKQPIKCFIQLYRPSDEAIGEARSFELLPRDTVTIGEKGKRKRAKLDESSQILSHIQEAERLMRQSPMNLMEPPIKTEPRESTSPYAYAGSPGYSVGSPYTVMGGSPYPAASSANSTPQYNYDARDNINYNYLASNLGTQPIMTWNLGPNIQSQQHMPPSSSTVLPPFQNVSNYPVFCDMDTGHTFNSADLAPALEGMPDQLPEINTLSLSDIMPDPVQDMNMTDSLTKLTNERVNALLNN